MVVFRFQFFGLHFTLWGPSLTLLTCQTLRPGRLSASNASVCPPPSLANTQLRHVAEETLKKKNEKKNIPSLPLCAALETQRSLTVYLFSSLLLIVG